MYDYCSDVAGLRGTGLELGEVVDLQLMDILYQVLEEEEGRDQQLSRLYGCLHSRSVRGSPNLYVNCHKINGLARCLQEYHLKVKPGKSSRAHGKQWYEKFMDRLMRWSSTA